MNSSYRRKEASYVDHNLDRFLVSIYYSKEDADDFRKPIVSKIFDYEDEADEYVANLGSRYGQDSYYVMEVLGEDDESYEWDEGYLFDSDHFSILQGKKVLSSDDLKVGDKVSFGDNYFGTVVRITSNLLTIKADMGEVDGEEQTKMIRLSRDEVTKVSKKKVLSREEEDTDSPEAEEDDPISTDKTPPGSTDDLPAPGEELDSFLFRDAINAVRKATVGLQTAIDHFERDIPQSTFDELVDDLEGLREKLEEIVKDTEEYLNPEEYNV